MRTLSIRNPSVEGESRRVPSRLERQAIGFTIGLYLFIAACLIGMHYVGPYLPQAETPGSSSTSPYSPK